MRIGLGLSCLAEAEISSLFDHAFVVSSLESGLSLHSFAFAAVLAADLLNLLGFFGHTRLSSRR